MENYDNSLQNAEQENRDSNTNPDTKGKKTGLTVLSAVAAFLIIRFFGALGILAFGIGAFFIAMIHKTKLNNAIKIILDIVIGIVCIVLYLVLAFVLISIAQ